MELGKLYRDIVETSTDGIWVFDVHGRTIYANPRIAEMLGRSVDELGDLTMFDALDAEGRIQFEEHLRALTRGEMTDHEVECLWVRKDGGQLWVLVRESALYDDQGNLQGYLHRVSDYSERRRLFEEISNGRQMLAEAQRIAKMGSYEWDLVHDEIRASDELHELYGMSREEFGATYDAFLELVHPDDRDQVDEAVAAALEEGEDAFDFIVRVPRDGETMWIHGRGEVFRDDDGVPYVARGTHQDVTDAKDAERYLEDLAGQNALMQLLASAANEAETLTELLLVAQPVLVEHDDWVRGRGFVPDPDRPGEVTELHTSRADKEADALDPDLVAYERALAKRALKERTQVWDEETDPNRPVVAFPVLLGTKVVIVLVITADEPFVRHGMIRQMIDQAAVQFGRVAEREQAAQELAAARDAAMEASRQKSEFLATMSHEIRTPLNGVIGLSDLLLRTDLDPHQQRLASGAQIASRALLGIINDILDFSKIEAGRLELEDVDFEVRPVFDQVASLLAETARSKGLELLVSCHPDVPEYLNGDPTRLAQVLTNLGSNAVKFTEEGEVFIRATAQWGKDAKTILRVEVSDTGVGVDPSKREHIFDAFSQADASTTRQYGGTGLGLAISREIVTAMDGQIGVDSTPGEGSTFWFTAHFGPAGMRAPDDAATRRRRVLAGRRVLVVDDNANNRLILSEHLGRWDVRSTTAASASRALELLREAYASGERFEAVLLDMAMPEQDGMQLATTVSEDRALAGTPLIMLTSSSEPEPKDLAAVGIAECLIKPVLAGDVLDALLRVLERREPVDRRAALTVPAREPQPATPPQADRPRLLVVEDNPVNQLVAMGILEALGYAAETADDGLDAVAKWRNGTYAGVLMDVQMPRMDGYAATRTIRDLEAEGDRTPIIAMTAAAVEGEREKCLAAGMDDFLTKPVSPDVLGAALRRHLDGVETGPPAAPTASAVRAREESALDLDRLEMLRELDPGNTSYLDRAIGNFVDRAPEAVREIRAAAESRDAEELRQSAHRLKGSALNLGLPAVGRVAYELERIGDSGAAAGAAVLLGDLEAALAQAVTEVLAYQRGYQHELPEATGHHR